MAHGKERAGLFEDQRGFFEDLTLACQRVRQSPGGLGPGRPKPAGGGHTGFGGKKPTGGGTPSFGRTKPTGRGRAEFGRTNPTAGKIHRFRQDEATALDLAERSQLAGGRSACRPQIKDKTLHRRVWLSLSRRIVANVVRTTSLLPMRPSRCIHACCAAQPGVPP